MRTALPVLLDLLLAAGLLRLAAASTPEALTSVAAVVVVRRLASTGIRLSVRSRHVDVETRRRVPTQGAES